MVMSFKLQDISAISFNINVANLPFYLLNDPVKKDTRTSVFLQMEIKTR